MANNKQSTVFDEDVYVVTDKGDGELRGAATSLSPPELELLVHIDGLSTIAEIKARIKPLAADTIIAAFEKLSLCDFIKMADKANPLDFVEYFNAKTPARPSQGAITEATAEASVGTSTLQKDGFYVRIARRAATARKLVKGETASILVVEDEPHLVKFLRQFLTLEGFDTRIAINRNEIIEELRRTPLPDLVLLDVMLHDADGFDVLLKIRQHPAVKAVPVVMLTAKATRDAVLTGLANGADGYITKPFEVDVLLKAIKTVLGLPTT